MSIDVVNKEINQYKKMRIWVGFFLGLFFFNQEMRKYQRKQSHKKKNLMVTIQLVIQNGLLFFANKFG